MKLDITDLGARIAIIGGSNAGKSTLATKLAEITGLPIYHLDRYRFEFGGWQKRSKAEFLKSVEDITKNERWIIEGSYDEVLTLKMQRATSFIHLTPSRFTCAHRYYWRSRNIAQQKEAALGIPDGAVSGLHWRMFRWILYGYPKDEVGIRRNLQNFTGPLYRGRSFSV